MTDKSRETLQRIIAVVLADNRVYCPHLVVARVADAVIASGLTAEKEWTE